MKQSVLILLAEDEALIAAVIEDDLIHAGYRVRLASSGDQAIETLDDLRSEVSGVITDIRLSGGVDGWTVARHARELTPNIPVVYMSGDSAHEHTVHGVPDSIMLQKPFASGQLITAISTLLNAVPLQPPER